MPIIPASSVTITNQVLPLPSVQPYVNQMDFGTAIGRVSAWNPNALAQCNTWINDAVRKIYGRKTWFSLFIKGQIVCPVAVTTGTATVVSGSPIVTGSNGTAWTVALIGRQFRIGYNNPIYSITDVDETNQLLTLELPWGGTSTTSGYFIVQYYFPLGPNIKYVKSIVNMQLGYKVRTNLTQEWLDARDPWRQNQNFPWAMAPMPLAPDGSYLIELYPVSWIQQALPFRAYIQPPNLVNDQDQFPAYIRSDIVIKDAISKALVFGGPKKNPYYDVGQSQIFAREFESELNNMANEDDNLYRSSVMLPGEDYPFYEGGGSYWQATHACMADGGMDF